MKKTYLALMCLIVAFAISGCGQDNKNSHDTDTGMGSKSMDNRGKSTINTYGNHDNNNMNSHNDKNHHSMLMQHVRGVEGVTDSTIFVDDQNILVGLDLKDNMNRNDIEQKVRNILQKDHNGQNIHVTSDSKFHERIRALDKQRNDTNGQNGNVVNNMANDIKTLIDDIGKSVNKAIK